MDSLSSDHKEKVDEFKSITGSSTDSENDDKIIEFLTVHDFDLNNAISTYFDSGFDSIGNSSAINQHDEIDNQVTHRHSHHHQNETPDVSLDQSGPVNLQHQMFFDSLLPKLPKAPVISNGWQLEVGIHTSILDEKIRQEREKTETTKEDVYETTESIHSGIEDTKKFPLSSLWIILLIIPKTLLHVILSALKFVFGWRVFKGPEERLPQLFNYEKFIPNYKFLPELKPSKEETNNDVNLINKFNFREDQFNETHLFCQKEYRWLLVVLVNDSSTTKNFIESLVNHKHFDKLFNKSNGLFKETEIFVNNIERSPEAFEIAQTYKVKRLPYVMLVGNVSASPDIMPSMSIVYKSNIAKPFITEEELPNTTNKILKNIGKLLERFNPQLVSARFDKQEMEISRQIRQEQDDAYLRSLQQDKIKKEMRLQEENAQKLAEQKSQLRQYYLLKLISTKYIEQNVLDQDVDAKCKIALKLPNGKRIVELFNGEITLLEFYMFIELKLFIEQEELDTDQVDDLIEKLDIDDNVKNSIQDLSDYHNSYPFKFEVIQPYPKKVIHLDVDMDQSIKDISEFSKGANFLIEFIDDDEEEEEEE